MKQLFILREPAGHIAAGSRVFADSRVGDTVFVHSEHALLPSIPVPSRQLLPFRQFLTRKPKFNFWALRRYWKESEFISRPYHEAELMPEYGPIPFHFESLGEASFYLRLINHKSDDYLICQFMHVPELVK